MNVKRIRHRTGLSQAAFAQRVGVSQPAVAQWESGATKPTVAQAAKIENILNDDDGVVVNQNDDACDALICSIMTLFKQIPENDQRLIFEEITTFFDGQI